MPVPIITFTKQMTSDERVKALANLQDWCQSPESQETKAKVATLLKVIHYAQNHLISSGRAFLYSTPMDESDFQLCDTIFQHADLPELLFLQHVIVQIGLIKPNPHPMRDEILPLTQRNKDALMIATINRLNMFIIFAAGYAAGSGSLVGKMLCALAFGFKERLVDMLISSSLDKKLTFKKTGGVVPQNEIVLNGVLDENATQIVNQAYRVTTSLFHQAVENFILPKGKNEAKLAP